MRGHRRVLVLLLIGLAAALAEPRPLAAGWLCDRLGLTCPEQPDCGPLRGVTDFGANPGDLQMCAYEPPGLAAGRPLVVALHGCSQQAADFALPSGWMQLAATHGFALLLPQQRRANNPMRCFNWFRPDDVRRHDGGGTVGEVASIRSMIDRMQAEAHTSSVYVAGLSAGGAMAAALLAAYPEVFQGGAIIAGVPFGCADGLAAAVRCLNPGKDLPAEEWGRRVRDAAPGHPPRRRLRLAIWHGLADSTVAPRNADELTQQWTDVTGLGATAGQSWSLPGASIRRFAGDDGTVQVEQVLVSGMAHGMAVDPANGCGTTAPFMLDIGLCASHMIAEFWAIADVAQRSQWPADPLR
jgi:poly(hydroxyalkanoate) depolymerase family esterase